MGRPSRYPEEFRSAAAAGGAAGAKGCRRGQPYWCGPVTLAGLVGGGLPGKRPGGNYQPRIRMTEQRTEYRIRKSASLGGAAFAFALLHLAANPRLTEDLDGPFATLGRPLLPVLIVVFVGFAVYSVSMLVRGPVVLSDAWLQTPTHGWFRARRIPLGDISWARETRWAGNRGLRIGTSDGKKHGVPLADMAEADSDGSAATCSW